LPTEAPTARRWEALYTRVMDAAPLLGEVAKAMRKADLEAVLIGNAAAAIHGAPVTTIDFDFYFRKTARNLSKLKEVARALAAVVMKPYYPVSDMYRISRDRDGLQVDFMATIHGVRSFEGLRDRATMVEVGGVGVRVAALDDIIRSKLSAGRARDRAVLEILEQAREEASIPSRKARRPRTRK
jgi:predicted nucleotidyltransferase